MTRSLDAKLFLSCLIISPFERRRSDRMQLILMVLTGLHILAGVFWAGSTFTIARSGGTGASTSFGPQMGAATLTILAGVGLWGILHRGVEGPMEHTLALGALCAVA